MKGEIIQDKNSAILSDKNTKDPFALIIRVQATFPYIIQDIVPYVIPGIISYVSFGFDSVTNICDAP